MKAKDGDGEVKGGEERRWQSRVSYESAQGGEEEEEEDKMHFKRSDEQIGRSGREYEWRRRSGSTPSPMMHMQRDKDGWWDHDRNAEGDYAENMRNDSRPPSGQASRNSSRHPRRAPSPATLSMGSHGRSDEGRMLASKSSRGSSAMGYDTALQGRDRRQREEYAEEEERWQERRVQTPKAQKPASAQDDRQEGFEPLQEGGARERKG
jgi:hypothetical protein